MSNVELSTGICARLQEADSADNSIYDETPVVQFLSLKKIAGTEKTPDRYRIVMSDGEYFLQAILATQLNQIVEDGELGKSTIVRLDKYTVNLVQSKRLYIILGLTVLQKDADKVGNPIAYPGTQPASAAAPFSESGPATSSTSGPPAQAQSNRHSQHQGTTRANARGGAGGRNAIYPIEGLSPYQNNWTIRARVTQKSDIKTWSNQRGEGKLFNVTLMDESGEIKATGFNSVVDEFYDRLQEGKVYYISKARVNLAKKKFSNIQNDYELSIERNTEVEECLEPSSVPMIKYNFIPLGELDNVQKDATCDIIGIITEVGPLSEIVTKTTNKSTSKRELTLVDKTKVATRLTLWGKQAEQFSANDHPVVACKGVKVSDFNGRSLSLYSSSIMSINPDIDEAFALRGWYDGSGNTETFTSHSSSGAIGGPATFNRTEVRCLLDVKDSQLGMSDKADYFSTRATIMHIKNENLAYPGCRSDGCNKKVVENDQGAWRCEKCDKSYESPQYRYMMSMAVADYSGQAWLQCFNDTATMIMGMTADELISFRNNGDEEAYNSAIARAIAQTWNFSCRAKMDSFNDTARVRYGVNKVYPINYREEGAQMIEVLKSAWAQ